MIFIHTPPSFGSNLLFDYVVISHSSSFYNRSVSRYIKFVSVKAIQTTILRLLYKWLKLNKKWI